MRRTIFSLFVAIPVAGCQTPTHDPTKVPDLPLLSSGAADSIAGDLAARLAQEETPASTTIFIAGDRSQFAMTLKRALSDWGYAVSNNPGSDKRSNAVNLSYSLTGLEGQILARLSTPEASFGRIYTTSETGAEPNGPFTILQHD